MSHYPPFSFTVSTTYEKLHHLWTKAVGTPDYDKAEWREFEAEFIKLEKALGRGSDSVSEEPDDQLAMFEATRASRARANAAVMGEAIPLMKVMQVNGEFENGQGHLDPEHCPTCKEFANRNRPPGPPVEVKSELWTAAKGKMRQVEAEIHKCSTNQRERSNMLHTLSKLCMFASDAWEMHVIRPAQRTETPELDNEIAEYPMASIVAFLEEVRDEDIVPKDLTAGYRAGLQVAAEDILEFIREVMPSVTGSEETNR